MQEKSKEEKDLLVSDCCGSLQMTLTDKNKASDIVASVSDDYICKVCDTACGAISITKFQIMQSKRRALHILAIKTGLKSHIARAEDLMKTLPNRELAIAITKMQEAIHWIGDIKPTM